MPLRRVCALRYGDSLAETDRRDGDVPVYGSNGVVGSHDHANTVGMTIVVGRKGSFGKLQFSRVPVFAIDTTFYIDATSTSADLRWLFYAMSTLPLDQLSFDVGVPGLSRERAYEERLAFPDRPTQVRVAAHLDAETARIDALIAKKRRLIALLVDRRDVITRGSIAAVAHVSPLRRHWRVIDCRHLTPVYVDEGIPVVGPGDVQPGRLDLRRCHRFVGDRDFADLTAGERRPCRGDIVYSRNASIGIAAYVDTDETFTMGQDVCLIRSESHDQRYLAYVLNTMGVDQLQAAKVGATFDRVNISQILDLRIPVPPPDVQRKLADQFDELIRRTSAITHKLTQQIALLQEHRQAIITAAVTQPCGSVPVAS